MIASQSMVTFEHLLFITLKVEVALNDYLFLFWGAITRYNLSK